MSITVATASTIILSVVLYVLYYMVFGDKPEKGITVIMVAFAGICVFIARSIGTRLRKK
jgi:hypothetical protein